MLASGLQPTSPSWTPWHGIPPAERLQSQRGEASDSTSGGQALGTRPGRCRLRAFCARNLRQLQPAPCWEGKEHMLSRRASSERLTAQERQGRQVPRATERTLSPIALQPPGAVLSPNRLQPPAHKVEPPLGAPRLSTPFRWVYISAQAKASPEAAGGFSGMRTALQGWAGVGGGRGLRRCLGMGCG